jgi:hypothetical protein
VFADALAPAGAGPAFPSPFFPDIAADRSASCPSARVAIARDGYRRANGEGKSKLAKARQAMQHKRFPSFAPFARPPRVYRPFIAKLKPPFKPADHDRRHKPVNGVGNVRQWTGVALGETGRQQS